LSGFDLHHRLAAGVLADERLDDIAAATDLLEAVAGMGGSAAQEGQSQRAGDFHDVTSL